MQYPCEPKEPAREYHEVVDPRRWRARAPGSDFEPRGALHVLVLHHTAIEDSLPQGGNPAAEAAYMRLVERVHLDRGWSAIGYHFVIMPSGRVFAGRPETARGAHTAGHNAGTLGIALAGNFEKRHPDVRALTSLHSLCERLAPKRSVPLIGHGELMRTACPGRLLREALQLDGAADSRRASTSQASTPSACFGSTG